MMTHWAESEEINQSRRELKLTRYGVDKELVVAGVGPVWCWVPKTRKMSLIPRAKFCNLL